MSILSAPAYLTECHHLTVVKISGADATTFLQSQLTQDMASVTPRQSSLAGFCTAQGRLWASMLLVKHEQADEVLAVVRGDLLESFLKRLKMFVLRSKVTLEASAELKVLGLETQTKDLSSLMSALGVSLGSEAQGSDWGLSSTACGYWVRVPSHETDLVRFLIIGSQQQVHQLGQTLSTPTDSSAWQIHDIQAGIPWVELATQDLFIAQTLNLDLIGGVSFTKGCYPGQEVVARAHYRGAVKRRMHLAQIIGPHEALVAAADIFTADEPENPVGRIINVASDNGQAWALFEAPFKAIEAAPPLHLGHAAGPMLSIKPLPYGLNIAQSSGH